MSTAAFGAILAYILPTQSAGKLAPPPTVQNPLTTPYANVCVSSPALRVNEM